MMGRTPDFLNVSFMAMAAVSGYFAENRPVFQEHIQRYYEYIREYDLVHNVILLKELYNKEPMTTWVREFLQAD